jgi:prophage regulatory protein
VKVLTVAEVCKVLSVSRATLARWQQIGAFPARRQIGPARVGWLERDVSAWLSSRPPALGTAEANAQAEALR